MEPTLAGFIDFIRNVMGISTANLPDAAPVIPMALSIAAMIVNPDLGLVSYTPGIAGTSAVSMYVQAVYNLAGDNVINFAPDPSSPPGTALYFSSLRDKLKINAFISGVIQASNDESTGNSMIVQEAAKDFTLANLQNLKTPWGRQYLAYAQLAGSSIVGFN